MDNKTSNSLASGPFTAAQAGTSQRGITPGGSQCPGVAGFSVKEGEKRV